MSRSSNEIRRDITTVREQRRGNLLLSGVLCGGRGRHEAAAWLIAFLVVSVVYMKEFLGFGDEKEGLDDDKMSAGEKQKVMEEVAKRRVVNAAAAQAGSALQELQRLSQSPLPPIRQETGSD